MNQTDRDRLNDVFPAWYSGGGIFSALQTLSVPWQSLNIATSLDLEYHGNISGEKYISPLVDKVRAGSTLTDAERILIGTSIVAMFGVSWGKEWATRSFEYNPIENYSMTEEMSDDETVTEYGKIHTRTDNLTHAKTGTDTETPGVTETRTDNLTHAKTGTDTETPGVTETRTDNLTHAKTGTDTETPGVTETRTDNLTHGKTGTETVTPDLTNNTSNSVFGFNSVTAVDTGASESTSTGNTETEYDTEETNTGTQTVSRTGNNQTEYDTEETNTGTQTVSRIGNNQTEYDTEETNTGTQTVSRTGNNQVEYDTEETDTGTVTDSDTGSDTHTRNYSLTRAGNIGVTTSQQMIQSERDLWVWNYFYDVVFPDIDRALTLRIY